MQPRRSPKPSEPKSGLERKGGKGRVAFLHQPHTQPKNKCIYKDKIQYFSNRNLVMLIQGCNIWETSIPFFSIKVSKPSFRSAPTSSEIRRLKSL